VDVEEFLAKVAHLIEAGILDEADVRHLFAEADTSGRGCLGLDDFVTLMESTGVWTRD